MVCRLSLRVLIAAVVLQFVASALFAGELGEFLSSVARNTKRRNCWPEPFIYADREATRQVNAIQEAAGWERQNLLSDFHFVSGGMELTEAGRMRVLWIVNEASEAHRQVFVHRANTPQETVVHMQTVQRGGPIALRRECPRAGVHPHQRRLARRPRRRFGNASAGAAVPPKLLGGAASVDIKSVKFYPNRQFG